jgi:prepilin-type N-terminal cleavage/methylation domain-containing protein
MERFGGENDRADHADKNQIKGRGLQLGVRSSGQDFKNDTKNMKRNPSQRDTRELWRQRGFTVVEVVVAILLMAICLYPIGRALVRVLTESTDDQRLAVCAYLAVEEIETVRTLSECYTDSTVAGTKCPPYDTSNGWGQNFDRAAPCNYPAPFNNYQCAAEYMKSGGADNPGNPGAAEQNNVWEIAVRVWYDTNGNRTWDTDEPDVVLETMLSKRHPI